MKLFFSFCCLLFYHNAYTQTSFLAGVANTYSLSEKEGYNGFIYSVIESAPNGTVYTCDYAGNVEVHGNNYSVKIDSLKPLGFISKFKIINDEEVWAMNDKYIAILKKNKLTRVVPLPSNTLHRPFNNDSKSVYIFTKESDGLSTWFFNSSEFLKVGTSQINTKIFQALIFEKPDGSIWLTNKKDSVTDIYLFNKSTKRFIYKKSYPYLQWVRDIRNENNLIASMLYKNKRQDCRIINGKIHPTNFAINSGLNNSYNFHSSQNKDVLYRYNGDKYFTALPDSNFNFILKTAFIFNDELSAIVKNTTNHFYFGLTGNRMLLVSPWIKKYPLLFHGSNASTIFTVREDSFGRIWAGSYKSNVAIIDKEKVAEIKPNQFKLMNGGSYYNNHMYLIGEGNGGLLQYGMDGKMRKVNTSATGFYTYISKNKKQFYFTTTNNLGVWQTSTQSLETLQPIWNKIDSSKGLSINNVLTIAEDTLGRIWFGHPKTGIAIYNPKNDKAKTSLIEKKETAFGGMCSLTDKKGTVWIGGRNGIWYYNDYNKEASPLNCVQLYHPLLNAAKQITALTIFNNWLVIAAYDKVLLLDLKRFYEKKKTVLRYLNPYEAAFTSFTEQNTMITAKDSSVWFSTSDMLYQWDIKNWLALKTYKVKTAVIITGNNKENILKQNNAVSFQPGFTSFDIHVQYVSPDNMPRYSTAALVKEGDTVLLPDPALQSIFSIKNVAAGNYNFVLDIFEMDGATVRHVYPIIIKKYLWQQWWFWALLSTVISAIILYLYNLKQKKRLAEEKAKATAAELHSFKSEQEKKLANLQLVTLSSQFRPHFILNALNTIGAQMDDKPEAESVLSRLGESVNLIFNHAQQHKILHPFENEWSLVKNVIHIHTLMYLKQLEVVWPEDNIIESVSKLLVPLGLLQIPVENALLHGLSNRENGPWVLQVQITEDEHFVYAAISDNGVGRKKSASLSNYTKHGTGTKNLAEIIAIINASNKDKIDISYRDDVYLEDDVTHGTIVNIEIPKDLNYNYG